MKLDDSGMQMQDQGSNVAETAKIEAQNNENEQIME